MTSMAPRRALVLGGLAVATLDILAAIVLAGLRGVAPSRVLQHIASGAVGPHAFTGGTGSALLGLALHFVVAFGVVATYHAAARVLPELARHPLRFGPIYGIVAYSVMQAIVVPLSAVATREPTVRGVLTGLAVHILCVGIPAALSARVAQVHLHPAPVSTGHP
jgi:hypothetical protein